MKSAFNVLTFFTILTGGIYPVLITGMSQVFFPEEANGSLIKVNGKVIGSSLVAQNFKSDKYFWSRPSAIDYDASSSGASNLGPTSKELKGAILKRKEIHSSHDLLTASASGLDPHLTVSAIEEQIERVARSRSFDEAKLGRLREVVNESIEKRNFGFMGQERINVLKLNLKLDEI